MKYAIETFDLTKKYDDFTAVDALNMKIDNKSIFGFLGPSGAGKSTTQKILVKLLDHYQGEITYDGKSLKSLNDSFYEDIGPDMAQSLIYPDFRILVLYIQIHTIHWDKLESVL